MKTKIVEMPEYVWKGLKLLCELSHMDQDLKIDRSSGFLSNVPWWNTANLCDHYRLELDLEELSRWIDKAV